MMIGRCGVLGMSDGRRSGGRENILFFVNLTAKYGHYDWIWLSQTSCLLIKLTKNKIFSLPPEHLRVMSDECI